MPAHAIEGCRVVQRIVVADHDFRPHPEILECWVCARCDARLLLHPDRSPLRQVEQARGTITSCRGRP